MDQSQRTIENIFSSDIGILLLIAVLVLLFIYSCVGKSESFDPGNPYKPGFQQQIKTVESNPIEWRQKELPTIYPPQYTAYDATIQSGTKFIPQNEFYTPWGNVIVLDQNDDGKSGYANDDKGIGDNGLNFNLCSPSCCSDQWPLPFKMPVDKMTCGSEDDYVPTSYYCNNGWQNSGCLCMKKSQANFIDKRGDNRDYPDYV